MLLLKPLPPPVDWSSIEHSWGWARGRRWGRLLTIVGAGRDRWVVPRRGRGKTVCARVAWQALLGGRSTSPLGISNPTSILIVKLGGNMTKRLSRIAPWQAGKLFALIYFFFSLLFVIPMLLISMVAPMPAGPGHRLGPGMILFLPF